MPISEVVRRRAPPDLVVVGGLRQKNGVRFEAVVAKREAGNPRFAFLQPSSPFHAYYRCVLVPRAEACVRASYGGRASQSLCPSLEQNRLYLFK